MDEADKSVTASFDYEPSSLPDSYECSECGASRVKLWRRYRSTDPLLRCVDCAGRHQGIDIHTMDQNGLYIGSGLGVLTDQIGRYVPAVPDTRGDVYLGYSSLTQRSLGWWQGLPLRQT